MCHSNACYPNRSMTRRGAQLASLLRLLKPRARLRSPAAGDWSLPLVLLLTLGMSSSLRAEDLSITVDNITELEGTLYWSLYDSQAGYDSEQSPIATGSYRVLAETLRLTLHDLPPGQYALKLFHDANDNGKLDTNLLGIPQEGYGFSNNGGSFGPASYSDARFDVSADTSITISLR